MLSNMSFKKLSSTKGQVFFPNTKQNLKSFRRQACTFESPPRNENSTFWRIVVDRIRWFTIGSSRTWILLAPRAPNG